MPKTLTITISDKNISKLESLGIDTDDEVLNSFLINHFIGETILFEELSGMSITEWCKENYKEDYIKFCENYK